MDHERYLERIGMDPASVGDPDLETLARLQRAHVTSVPFETLAVAGDPFEDGDGGVPSLSVPDLYDKVVRENRGGWCFELNGLFGWLLAELGYDADRIAARVRSEGDPRPPANHHSHLVHLDRPYVVDVGMGSIVLRRPLPLDGSVHEDDAGFAWRVVEADRPDAEYLVEYREPGEDWSDRYDFTTRPRDLDFFRATCEYLATAPESPFTGAPVVSLATDRGYRKLQPDGLIRVEDGERVEEPVDREGYYDRLERTFGLRYPPE